MDEMSKLREWRADAPAPGRERLAPGRRRLLDAAGARRRRRLPALGDWRVVSGAVAAGVTAVALLSTNLGGGTGGEGTPAAGGDVQVTEATPAPPSRASELLQKAAVVVAADPVPEPEEGDWVYVREVSLGVTDPADDSPATREDWYEYADPEFENWNEGDDHSPRERFEYLAALPEDTDAVLQKARWFYPQSGGRPDSENPGAGRSPADLAEWNFSSLRVLAGTAPMHPVGLSRVYEAMATIPGLRVAEGTVKDAAGRRALAFSVESDPDGMPVRDEVLIDPTTYTYLGTRSVATDDMGLEGGGDEKQWVEGDIVTSTAVLTTALVDDDGLRP
ncbi:CU044_5270 family protein [Streptomyces sp. NPDC004134]|uniref:CU044_5270 family protein n=1 Tax=Streptomyces sp. NPDC004134 TaxID=3364691 RepID=UPI00367FF7B5